MLMAQFMTLSRLKHLQISPSREELIARSYGKHPIPSQLVVPILVRAQFQQERPARHKLISS